MSDVAIGIAAFPVMLALILSRVPIGLAMFGTGFLGLVLITGDFSLPLARLKNETYTTFSNYSLSIIPMFLLMGNFAAQGGMSQALFKAAQSWIGHRRGGVAMATIGACAGFGAICGSSLATAATMGRVALPELKRYGYPPGFSAATIAAGGTLGILIPPSLVLVIYAILTEQNIAKLFVAAIVPGLIAVVGFTLAVAIYVRVNPEASGTQPRIAYAERMKSLAKVWPVVTVFALVVGGIYAGWFTPTEGAAVGALATGIIAWRSGGLDRRGLSSCFNATARTSAMIFFIILGAAFFNGFLALTGAPQQLAAWIELRDLNPYLVIVCLLIMYLLLGCVMDSLSMILLTIPIFWPILLGMDFAFVTMAELHAARFEDVVASGVKIAPDFLDQVQATIAAGAELTREQLRELGMRGVNDFALERINTERLAIWFGIMVLIVVEVGLVTPPIGMNIFIVGAMDRTIPVIGIYKAIWYFVASDLIRVVLLFAFPVLTLGFLSL
ncbi:MAG: TRAP transporter large permease [Pseudomonadota bacterium]